MVFIATLGAWVTSSPSLIVATVLVMVSVCVRLWWVGYESYDRLGGLRGQHGRRGGGLGMSRTTGSVGCVGNTVDAVAYREPCGGWRTRGEDGGSV